MGTAATWAARLVELYAGLSLSCAVLADRTATSAEREHATAAFTDLWPRYCALLRTAPAGASG